MFSGAKPFVQFWLRVLYERIQEMSFKRFLIWSSGSPTVQWSRNIYEILKEGIMGKIHVKFYETWTSGSGGDVV